MFYGMDISVLKEVVNYKSVLTKILSYMPKLILASVILLFFYLVFASSKILFKRILMQAKVDENISKLVIKAYKYILMIFGFIIALDQLGVNVGAAIAGLGIAGIALGFAAKDTVANIISGITVFMDKPFTIGDYIEVENSYGMVVEITLRSTRIRTLQNEYVVIPNQSIVNEKLINHSKHGGVRVEVPVAIAYKENIDKTREALLKTTKGDKRIISKPKPVVVVEKLGTSSVNVALKFWINNVGMEKPITFEYLEKVKKALDKAGIEIPFPHLQLFIDRLKSYDFDEVVKALKKVKGK